MVVGVLPMAVEEPKDLQMTERYRALINEDFSISPLFSCRMTINQSEQMYQEVN